MPNVEKWLHHCYHQLYITNLVLKLEHFIWNTFTFVLSILYFYDLLHIYSLSDNILDLMYVLKNYTAA